jgi:hypothetical protein
MIFYIHNIKPTSLLALCGLISLVSADQTPFGEMADEMLQSLSSSGGHAEGELDEHTQVYGFIIFLFTLGVYISVGSWMETKKLPFGHETGAIIIYGMIFSFVVELAKSEWLALFQFHNAIFFDVLLPLIIFATAFNMRRKSFFTNIANVAKFGLLGTVLTFVFYSALTIAFFKIFGGEEGITAKYYFTE